MGTSDTSALEHVVATALRGDDASNDPVEVRSWIDGAAILIVARCEHEVAEAFYISTGELLRPCGQSSDPQRSLLVLAFSHDLTDTLEASRGRGGHTPLADAS